MFFCDSYPLPMYECDLCDYKTDLKVTLYNHNRVVHEEKHDNSDQKSILVCNRCNNCNFETYSLLVVTKHVQNCNKTSKNIQKKSQRPTYKKIDHDKWYEYRSSYGGRWCKCKHCSYFSRYTTSIKIHVLSKHTAFEDIAWFKCEYCCYKSKQKGNLKTHVTKKHGQQKERKQCSCGKERTDTSGVEEIASWFECERCSYKSRYKSSLNRHISGIHGNPEQISWLQCKYCSFLTKRKFCLENHLLRKHYPGVSK